MNHMTTKLFAGGVTAAFMLATPVLADVSPETIKALGAPDSIETSIGTLDFKDGAPSADTAQKVFDALDFTRALNVYNNSFRGASALGIQKGLESVGVGFNEIAITSKLMDSTSLFLTGNADTVYYLSVLDLSKGPIVVEQPTDAVGTINDMWFSWIVDIGAPGPDRGLGGKYLIVGPDYDGPLPEGGYFIDPDTGDVVCQSVLDGSDPNCQVYNPFQGSGIVASGDPRDGITQAAIDYVSIPLLSTGEVEEVIANAYLAGDLVSIGNSTPIGFVLGAEYREELISTRNDAGFQTQDGAGQGSPQLDVFGKFDVKEVFGELRIPIIEDSFVDLLALELG